MQYKNQAKETMSINTVVFFEYYIFRKSFFRHRDLVKRIVLLSLCFFHNLIVDTSDFYFPWKPGLQLLMNS